MSIASRKDKVEPKRVKPYIPKELLDYLEEQYPEIVPVENQSRDSIMRYAGKRELVISLRRLVQDA